MTSCQAICRGRPGEGDSVAICMVSSSAKDPDGPIQTSKYVPSDSDEVPGFGCGGHIDRDGRKNVTATATKGTRKWQPLSFEDIRQYFHNRSNRIGDFDQMLTDSPQPERMKALYSALAAFQLEETMERIHRKDTYVRSVIDHLTSQMRFQVPTYEESSGVWAEGLNRRDPAVKAHAREMNRMLGRRRPQVSIADAPAYGEHEVRDTIRENGNDAVRNEQLQMYDSMNLMFFPDGTPGCSISSMVATREDLSALFTALKDRGITPQKAEQVVAMCFYTVYAHRGVNRAVDAHLDALWDRFMTMYPRKLQVFELLFQLIFAVQRSCGETFEWTPLLNNLKWWIRAEDMDLEPAIQDFDWQQPEVCVKCCGVNPATLSLPVDGWVCTHGTNCDCPCVFPYNEDTGEGFCRDGDCRCAVKDKCTHAPKSLHSSLAKMLFKDADEKENEVLHYLLFGNHATHYKGEWKVISDLLKVKKLSMHLTVLMIKSIFSTWFGIKLSTMIMSHGGAHNPTSYWCLTTGKGAETHNRNGPAVHDNHKQMSMFRFALLKFGLDHHLFEVMLGATAYRNGTSNTETCLREFYLAQGISNEENPFRCFIDTPSELDNYDPNATYATTMDNPVREPSTGLQYTPYTRGPEHARVITGVYQAAGIRCTPL